MMKSKHESGPEVLPLYLLYKYIWETETELVCCWALTCSHSTLAKQNGARKKTADRPYFLAFVTEGPTQPGPPPPVGPVRAPSQWDEQI